VIVGGFGALLLLPVLVIGAATGGLQISNPSQTATDTIPAEYLALYEQAGVAFGIPWELLAGIGKVECDHGQSTDPACWEEGVTNSAGAGGPMQFLASTWAEYGISPDGDNPPDRWDPADAVFSAANYLRASGAPGNIPAAVYAYNHSQAYISEVLAWAATYTQQGNSTDTGLAGTATGTTAGGGSSAVGLSGAAQEAVAWALAQIGTPYEWGAEDPGIAFDCSGLTQAAYATVGIQLPRTAQAQYDAGPPVPSGQPLEPGDLVFFGAGPTNIEHVGVVIGNGEMVDAPHTGANVRIESYDWSTYIGATRPVGAGATG
jgi:cell wall-associated NlpC family hydrolase